MRKFKEFKVIKKYPGSEAVGTIVKPTCCYDESEYLKYPELFEEIKEVVKDYEILEFRQISTGIIFAKQLNGNYASNPTYPGSSLDTILKHSWNEIYKIKRLSDGVEFKIGDKVVWDWKECGDNKYLTIKEFVINTIKYDEHTIGVNLEFCCGKVDLFETIITSNTANTRLYVEPKVLFTTTADDVDITEYGKELHWIIDDDHSTRYLYGDCVVNKSNIQLTQGITAMYKVFYCETKAKEYVAKRNEEKLLDSKVLSYNDVQQIIRRLAGYPETTLKEIKELVKSKQ